MDKDKLKGAGKGLTGKVQEGVGKFTGDEDQEAEGKGRQVEGEVQEKYGDLKDKAREVGKKFKD